MVNMERSIYRYTDDKGLRRKMECFGKDSGDLTQVRDSRPVEEHYIIDDEIERKFSVDTSYTGKGPLNQKR